MSGEYVCPAHGIEVVSRGGCEPCSEELKARADAAATTGDERAEEVLALLTSPTTVQFTLIRERIEKLVGRGVWTHEMVNASILAEEARDWQHPGDLEGHVLGVLRDAIGDKPVIVVRPGPPPTQVVGK